MTVENYQSCTSREAPIQRLPSGADLLPDPSDPSFPLEFAAWQERLNFVAVRQGLPAIGARMVNPFGIEWVIDGHTYAPSISTLGKAQDWEDPSDLYPVSIPQNLSPRLPNLLAEIDLCTPKAIMFLDTVPSLRPAYAHPGGHSVDGMSDPHRILVFIDAISLHEAVLAHELGHIWIELVDGIEDYRVLKDKSEATRYGQVQLLQSFVLDFRVNQMLRARGFDLTHIDDDRVIAFGQLLQAVKDGYRPPSKWESVFTATFLAEVLLEADKRSLVSVGSGLDAVSQPLPDEWQLAEDLKAIIDQYPPKCRDNAIEAINRVLTTCFAYAGEHLNLDEDLIEVSPEVEWRDKRPDWIPGLSAQQKCEVGKLMARTRVGANTEVMVEDDGHGAYARFRPAGGDWTEPHRLSFSVVVPRRNTMIERERIMQLNEQNRRRQMERMNVQTPAVPKPPVPIGAPRTIPGPPRPGAPGHRHYSTGMARFVTRVRMEQFLQGEDPYAYANSNPTTYTDPSGKAPQSSGQSPIPVYPGWEWTPDRRPIIHVPPPPCWSYSGLPANGSRPPLCGGDYIKNCQLGMMHKGDYIWFFNQMKWKAPMDYKHRGGGCDDGGNYNFGVVAFCAGLSRDLILRGAGFYKEYIQGRKNTMGGPFLGDYPYGNEIDKEDLINKGYCDAQRNAAAFALKCSHLPQTP